LIVRMTCALRWGPRRLISGRSVAAVMVCAAATCTLALAAPPVIESAGAETDAGPRVTVATTGSDSERRRKVRITKRPGPGKIVMSMGPDVLPSLSIGDRLVSTAELEVTTDCAEPHAGCVGTPYKYNPFLSVRLVLASSRKTTGGEGAVEIASVGRKCNQRDLGHHCEIVFPGSSLDIAGQVPCAPSSCFLNMVVESHQRRAKRGNRLLIGENEPDGSVQGDHGRLNVTRFSPGAQPRVAPVGTTTALATSIPVVKGDGVVVYSQQLDGLKRNDQLAASASMTTDVEHLAYGPLVRSRLILALDPSATKPGKDVKRLTEDPKAELTEANGFNCTQRRPRCLTRKVGVITMSADAEDASGLPIPLYVNLVVDTANPGSTDRPSDVVSIDPLGGGLQVTRYPASMKG
jgi:hypothetical protein